MTDSEFAYQQLRRFLRNALRKWESRVASETAEVSAATVADADSTFID